MDEEDRRTVSTDGIAVEKHVDTDRFKTAAVVLDIASTIDVSATVTVTEPIPDAFAIKDIGFHPEFGGENWSISGREIIFERSIDPGEEYTTVYGVRGISEEEITTVLDTELTVETEHDADGAVVDDAPGDTEDEGDEKNQVGAEAGDTEDEGADPIEGLLAENEDDVVRDVIAGERDSLSETESASGAREGGPEEAATGGGDEREKPPEEEPATGADEETAGETEGSDVADTADDEEQKSEAKAQRETKAGSTYRTLPGSVAEALAAEVSDGTIAPENERVLREAFGDPGEASGSVDARIQDLQSRVADIGAYTDALERFLDEHGGGDSVIGDLEDDLADVTESVDALEDGLDDLAEETADLESDLGDVESELEGALEEIAALDDRFEEVDVLADSLEDAETEIEDLLYLEEEVMELQTRTQDLPDLEETVAALREERVADLDSRLDGLADAVDTLDAEMEEMKEFRDRLSSAFGPGGEVDE